MTKKLSCGGKGPCCHIGYSHRHCEHCDTVIATAPYWWQWPIPTAPFRPYQPYWGTNTAGGNYGNQFGDALTSQSVTLTPNALPVAHVCEDER